MGDIERQIVSDMYPGPDWKKRVRQMSDTQVIAIYLKERNQPKKTKEQTEEISEQTSDDPPF